MGTPGDGCLREAMEALLGAASGVADGSIARGPLLQRNPVKLRAIIVEDTVAFPFGHVGRVLFQ